MSDDEQRVSAHGVNKLMVVLQVMNVHIWTVKVALPALYPARLTMFYSQMNDVENGINEVDNCNW